MSTLSASKFILRMKTDQDFAHYIASADSKEKRHNLIQSNGYHFSQDEFNKIFDEHNDEALINSMRGNALRGRECVCCKL